MRNISLIIFSFIFILLNSCAPVKFSKTTQLNPKGHDSIGCNPKINETLVKFTYPGSENPHIVSQCLPSTDVTYSWIIKRADGSIINDSALSLSGANPTNIDFQPLGPGSYYVYLTATDNLAVLKPFNASTPLEFVVPGAGENPLACDPKLNDTFSSVVIGQADQNPKVSANCNPLAEVYTWSVYKDGVQVVVPQLNGATSTSPEFKSMGVGEYKVYLYATATAYTSWQSSNPLVVKIVDDNPPAEDILCNPRLNGTLTNLTLTPASPNPLVSANCSPIDIQYNWSVTKNGQTINVPALEGSNSNPDFISFGEGNYLIYLTATRAGYNSWTTTSPLVLNVEAGGPSELTINCSPRLNNDFVAMTLSTTGQNPSVSSGCNPTQVTHTWTVVKDGVTLNLAGLSGALSTPNFIGTGEGTYLVYLTASAPGYNTYVSPSPLEVTVNNGDPIVRHVTTSKDVVVTDNKVDIVLIVDDSNSMLPENQKLAQKLKSFVDDLSSSGLDWNICSTVTRAQTINGNLFWGASKNWVGYVGSPQWILKAGATDPYSIFTNTINQIGAGWAGTDDERAIKAAYSHADYDSYNTCYRPEASLAVIILSDEDERSVGGNKAFQYYWNEWKALEAEDQPQTFVNKIKQKFGADKALTVNSIIVKPDDSACMASQDSAGAKSHYGYKYQELSQLTQGYVGSICDNDYSQSLYYFKDKIKKSISSINLECAPIGNINIAITPVLQGITSQIVNNSVVFTPDIPAGRNVTVNYDCPAVR